MVCKQGLQSKQPAMSRSGDKRHSCNWLFFFKVKTATQTALIHRYLRGFSCRLHAVPLLKPLWKTSYAVWVCQFFKKIMSNKFKWPVIRLDKFLYAYHFQLLPLPSPPQLGAKLADEPSDLLWLKSKTAAFYEVDKQPYLCSWRCHPRCRIQNTSTRFSDVSGSWLLAQDGSACYCPLFPEQNNR